ncbi:MAG: YceI family protein [Saprospiraceae bacterium]|nr:YceI family protein [Saprospiraceae bacterium]
MSKQNTLYFLCFSAFLLLNACKSKQNQAPPENVDFRGAKDYSRYGTRYVMDTVNSIVRWLGSKPTGTHNGTILLSKGEVFTQSDGSVLGGMVWLNMKTIECTDITDPDDKKDMEEHLKSDEFFDVDSFPMAEFFIDSFQIVKEENTNTHVFGQLTIKGISHGLIIKAQISMAEDLMMIEVPEFTIDRTKWNINYKSKSVFPSLADQFISDEITVSMTLLAIQQ